MWKILPILGGEFGMVRDDIKYKNGNPEHSEMVPSYIFLLESELGKVLVDTSFGDPAECEKKLGLVVKREKMLQHILTHSGINQTEVKAIILTHLHWDHAANCGMFPSSKIYCQESELASAFAPDSGYPPYFLEDIRNSMDRVVSLQGNAEVYDGIHVVHCGGHTIGSQMVEVQTEAGRAIITGDTIMTYKNVEQNVPVGLCDDPGACIRALYYIRGQQDALLLPSHDYSTMNYIKNIGSCKVKHC